MSRDTMAVCLCMAVCLWVHQGLPPQPQKLFLISRKKVCVGIPSLPAGPSPWFCRMTKGCHSRKPLPHSFLHLCPHQPLQKRVHCSQEEGWVASAFGSGFQGCLMWGSLTAAPQRAAAATVASATSLSATAQIHSRKIPPNFISHFFFNFSNILYIEMFEMCPLRATTTKHLRAGQTKPRLGLGLGNVQVQDTPSMAVGVQPAGPVCTIIAHWSAQGRTGSHPGLPPPVTAPEPLFHVAS